MTERLYRSGREKMLAGVCGGLADYFNVDVTLVRLVTLLAILMGGVGFLVYIVAWIIVPLNPAHQDLVLKAPIIGGEENIHNAGSQESSPDTSFRRIGSRGERSKVAGLVLIGLGFLFLLDQWFPFWFSFDKIWPVVLILIGAAIIWRRD
ncbi:MAG: PspC domain-containing protein [Desulfitobacterium hafniense]|nr:PspC domain-containing protein [Desulfitobacterium hafniense]